MITELVRKEPSLKASTLINYDMSLFPVTTAGAVQSTGRPGSSGVQQSDCHVAADRSLPIIKVS